MSKWTTGLAMTAALLTGGLIAAPAFASKSGAASEPGNLIVLGNGESKLFTQEGIDRAKNAMSAARFEGGMMLTFDTWAELPEAKKGQYKKETEAQFFLEWAKERASADHARGIYVLICRSPGYVEIIATKATRERGFTNENEQQLRKILLAPFHEAKDKPPEEQLKIRDAALKNAVEYVIGDLQGTHLTKTEAGRQAGMGVGGWVCLGLCVLLGVWLVIGLIRAFSGGGYGAGGGGFMSSLFGGLFGAMAGMWLYNSMFGHGGWFGGSDAYAGDGGFAGDNGDFTGDTGAGGSFDDGGFGGGDFGGDF